MIPIRLSLQGLYSYQYQQTIDFERLMQGQLFGIFGAVGSGKSSILEAITFALYGNTERMNQRDKRNYNMMNLKSNELLIDLEFMNYAGQRYRSVVKGKRSKTYFDQVNTFDRRFFEWKEVLFIGAGLSVHIRPPEVGQSQQMMLSFLWSPAHLRSCSRFRRPHIHCDPSPGGLRGQKCGGHGGWVYKRP